MKRFYKSLFVVIILSALASAATTTLGTTSQSTSNTTSYATSAFTTVVGEEIWVFVNASGTIATGTMTGTQLAYTKITSTVKNASADTLYFFVSNTLATSTSETLTFDCTGDAATGATIQAVRISGMTKTGTASVLQSRTNTNGGGGGTPSLGFVSNAQTSNPTFSFLANGTNPPGVTTPTNWTILDSTGFATPNNGASIATRDSGFTGTSIPWGSTSASGFALIIAEADTSGGTTTVVRHAKGGPY